MADKVIEKVRAQIVDDLQGAVIKQLLDDLRERKVLNRGEVESIIEKNPERAERARQLADSVRNKGPVASQIMITQLKIRDVHFYNKLNLDELLLQYAGANPARRAPAPGAPGNLSTGTVSSDGGSSKEYTMESDPRGFCVIFNNEKFKNPKMNRKGTKQDGECLEKVFKDLGFKVRTYHNKTAKEMKALLKSYSESRDHKDCFVCCILSHGRQEGVSGSDLETCSMKDILSPFDGSNCPPLAGKPKVFFIQACRGELRQAGVRVNTDSDATEAKDAEEPNDESLTPEDPGEAYTLPDQSDFLISMSTVEDYVSFRADDGSWFIQSLCIHLKAGSQRGEDILGILTEVNNDVSKKVGYEIVKKVEVEAKMIPEHRITLRKKLIFRIPM